ENQNVLPGQRSEQISKARMKVARPLKMPAGDPSEHDHRHAQSHPDRGPGCELPRLWLAAEPVQVGIPTPCSDQEREDAQGRVKPYDERAAGQRRWGAALVGHGGPILCRLDSATV